MHGFLSFWPRNYIGHALFGIAIALVGLFAVLLFTTKNSKTREWLFAKDKRIELVGLGILALVWLGFFVYNRITGT